MTISAVVWADAPGLVFRGEKDKGKLTVEIAPDAPVGPHLVRIYTAQGASAPRFFFVSAGIKLLSVIMANFAAVCAGLALKSCGINRTAVFTTFCAFPEF